MSNTPMRDAMEAAEERAIERRAARREYEQSTSLSAYVGGSNVVHAARPAFQRSGYVVLGCSGRAVRNMHPTAREITCRSCLKVRP